MHRFKTRDKIISAILIATVLVVFLYLSKITTNLGAIYSPHTAFRMQVNSLLKGQFGLSDSIQDLKEDHTWYNGYVQQPWGLGIPLLRLPFEATTRFLGLELFPDRFIFIYYFLLAIIILYISIWQATKKLELPAANWISFSSTALVALYPPFIAITRSRFSVYEEVISYGYLYGLVVFSSLLLLWCRNNVGSWLACCALAAFAPFIRASLLAYSGATILVAIMLVANKLERQKIYLGLILFSTILLGYFYTNFIRLGSPFEGGQGALVASDPSMLNVLKFNSEFVLSNNFTAKIAELYAALFNFNLPEKKYAAFAHNIFPEQTELLRWRFFYFPVFNYYYLVILVITPIVIVLIKNQRHFPIIKLAMFSFASFTALFAFYANLSFISSRYLVDFAASIAAASILLNLSLIYYCKDHGKKTSFCSMVGPILALALILNNEYYSYPQLSKTTVKKSAVSQYRVKSNLNRKTKPIVVPELYHVETDIKQYNIPYNGVGWNSNTGQLKNSASFMVFDPKKIKVVLYRINRDTILSLHDIEAKIGLEYLNLENIKRNGTEAELIFSAPTDPIYQKGPQILALRFAKIGSKITVPQFRLKQITWNEIS